MTKPSAIIAAYLDGQSTREQAAAALATAEWDESYQRASMEPNGDYDGDPFPTESFAEQIHGRFMTRELTAADYRAFQSAAVAWTRDTAEPGQ